MNTVLISVISFIAAVSIIVTVHEFGHFIVARWRGVRVLRFSIGFGKSLYSYQKSPEDTEYVVAAIPLGGYVKMLDEREGDVPQEQLSQAFNRKPVMDRIAIVFAGPLFNFIFAVLAYMIMYTTGVQGLRPEVGEVQAEGLAEQAGLRAGHLIREVDGRTVQTWEETALRLIDGGLKSGQVKVVTETDSGMREQIWLDLSDTKSLLGDGNLLDKIGLKPWRYPLEAVLGDLQAGKPASEQGLLSGDRILAANGEEISG